jgi:hypothetical protein
MNVLLSLLQVAGGLALGMALWLGAQMIVNRK